MTTTEKDTILLVDDDPQVLRGLHDIFEDDYTPLSANSGDEAIRLVGESPAISAVVLDIKMPGKDGITTARAIAKMRPDLAIIFHTGYPGDYDEHDIQNREKPFDYIEKGMSAMRLIRSVEHAVERSKLKEDVLRLQEVAKHSFGIIGRSAKMLDVFRLIQKVGPSISKVMIFGETGTGKELVAKALHSVSLRAEKRFAPYNCNHRIHELAESELFGHKRGAFTGADADRVGLFEHADGGTVFLDEIGELDMNSQTKILRVLECGEYQRLGESVWKKCDVRILCATHRNLDEMVGEFKFRQDLYYRLRGVEIHLPPLRDRREDIPLLAEAFLDTYTVHRGLEPRELARDAMTVLINHSWPGNVRDLKQTIESLVLLGESYVISRADVESYLKLNPSDRASAISSRSPLAYRIREFRRNCIIEALSQSKNNISEAARLLGVDRANLRKDIKELAIPVE